MVSVFLKDASQVKAANKKNDKYVDGYPVTTIKEMAFDDLEAKTIYFPYTVTKFKGTPIWSCNKLTGALL